MTDNLKNPQLRAIQYFYVDGSFEFGLGLLCLLLGVYFLVETHVHGLLATLLDISLVLVMIGGAWVINYLIKRLKEKLTYPCTGYVAYRREQGHTRRRRILIGMIWGGVVAAIGSILAINPPSGMNVLPLYIALAMTILLGFIGFRTALPRLYLLAGISLLMGVALSFSGLENYDAMTAYYLLVSLFLFTSGGITLWNYLRQNPCSAGDTR